MAKKYIGTFHYTQQTLELLILCENIFREENNIPDDMNIQKEFLFDRALKVYARIL